MRSTTGLTAGGRCERSPFSRIIPIAAGRVVNAARHQEQRSRQIRRSRAGLVLLLVLAVIAIVILIILCLQLQSQVGARARDLAQVQTLLSSRNDELMGLQSQMTNLVQRQFTVWRNREIQSVREEMERNIMEQARAAFHQWQMETEANIRADAIKRSSAVVSGKVTEHLMPYMGIFPYNPKDARFLGAPIDLIVFDGLSEGNLQEIVFLEVKTGASSLSQRERQIRDVISTRRVSWQEFRVST